MTPNLLERKYVPYYRVSTKRQGDTGHGLDAQKKTVRDFVAANSGRIGKEFTEVESGKRNDRPELLKAIAHARRIGGVLVVAKLDRLSRNAAFLLTLQEGKAEFVCCDMPEANELTVGIMAIIAQSERKAISLRTKEGLAAAKAKGIKLGSTRPGHWKGKEEKRREGARKGNAASVRVRRNRAKKLEAYRDDIAPLVLRMRGEGKSFRDIASTLNGEGYRTQRGAEFRPGTVQVIYTRASKMKGLLDEEE